MLRRASLGLVILLAIAGAPVFGQEVNLKLKFKEGDKFWVEEVTNTKVGIGVGGQQLMKSEEKSTMVISYEIKKVTREKIEVTMTIEDVQSKAAAGGVGGAGMGSGNIMEKTKGSSLAITLDPNGKAKSITGFDEIAKKLGGGEDEVSKVIKEALNEDTFVQMVEQIFYIVPDNAVKKGDSWKREATYPLPQLGTLKTTNTYTYNGKTDKGEEISLDQTMQYAPPKQPGLGGMFKVVKGDLKAEKAKGSYVFDADKGRVSSATSAVKLAGTLTVNVAGQEADVELSVDSNSTTRVLDRNPAKN